MAHLTGGGFVDNIPRVLPVGVGVRIDTHAWAVSPLFRLIQNAGGVSDSEMFRVFNMGIGFVLIVAPEQRGRSAGAGAGGWGNRVYRLGKVVIRGRSGV